MHRPALFALLLICVVAAPARAISGAAVIAELEKADHALEGANPIATARPIIAALLKSLASSTVPSARWLEQRLARVVLDLNANDAHAAHEDIHDLEEQIKKPSALTKAILKAKCNELNGVLNGGGADAIRRFKDALVRYDESLGPDFSPLAQWAQELFDEVLKVALTGSVPATAARLRSVIAQL